MAFIDWLTTRNPNVIFQKFGWILVAAKTSTENSQEEFPNKIRIVKWICKYLCMLFFHHLACIWSALQILLSIYKSSLMNTVFISWILDIHLNELSRTIAAIFFIHIFQFKDETKKIFLFLASWSISFLSFCYKGFFIGYFRVQIFELHLRFRSIFLNQMEWN